MEDAPSGSLEELEHGQTREPRARTETVETHDAEDIPVDVRRLLDIATADAGISASKHSDILWEEDSEAMMEISGTVGSDDWGGKPKKRRKVRRKKTELTDEQAEIVGQANLAYSDGRHLEAVGLLHKVIQGAPNAYQAWATLAILHDELGDADRALRTLMMAAHLAPKDGVLWNRLGDRSRKAGHNEQALYCFSHAIRVDPTDLDSLWDRAAIFHERGMYQKAINDYMAILKIIPWNMPAVKELCKLYLSLHDTKRAIALFEGAMKADAEDPLPPSGIGSDGDNASEQSEDEGMDDAEIVTDIHGRPVGKNSRPVVPNTRVGYEELNMLSELHMDVGAYASAVAAIKRGCRRILHSADHVPETRDEVHEDDTDFIEDEGGQPIPLDLQIKLGICRLYLDDPITAQAHFQPLYAMPVTEYGDLYLDVADAYMKRNMYPNALAVLDVIKRDPELDAPMLWKKMGVCHSRLGNLMVAAHWFETVLQALPGDRGTRFELATVCDELGDDERYNELVSEMEAAQNRGDEEDDELPHAFGADISGMPFGVPSRDNQTELPLRKKLPSFIREEEIDPNTLRDKTTIEAAEAQKRKQTLAFHAQVMELYPRIHEKINRAEFLRTARKLLARFQNTRAFYPHDRAKLFTGVRTSRRRSQTASVAPDTDADEYRDLVEPRMDRPPDTVEFQGLKFAQWYDVFVKYAYVSVMDGKEEEAQDALKSAFDANVFFHDETMKIRLRLHMISVAIYAGNAVRVTELCRWFCAFKPFVNDVYRLYCAMQAGGSEAVSCFAMASSLKYFNRQMKLMEKSAKANPSSPDFRNPLLLTVYGHILQAGRSYHSASSLYVKALSICPDDPLINFSLGLAHIQRGMQRKSDNRHMHMMQGFTCVLRYYELRERSTEATYNVGRAFHHVGLNHLAVPYYEQVLAASAPGASEASQDLRGEAAYNLSLIYVTNGSPGLAQNLLRKYCTF
ncbi:transcription factor TFIIIC subunit tfc4 [Geranomyces variabilis]|uniref:Transcription factor TFIIIC subunit tfc4 n=1 Tax=Geranomyces variabilis TaxID=109894 RepID=A0AAD5TCC5_9FUNG|nr:transcription factor TFIIIC subunit tfc4 [Geranomyces variabilis]